VIVINHARTLLLNVASDSIPRLGDELIPPDFQPVDLPWSIAELRRTLFGEVPDRLMLNYRSRQLLSLIHACELEEFVYALDPRVTYDLTQSPFADDGLYRPAYVSQEIPGGVTAPLFFVGTTAAPDATGRMLNEWDVTVDTATVDVSLRRPRMFSSSPYSITAGMSSIIGLTGSTLSFRFGSVSFGPGLGPRFVVTKLTRPTVDLSLLLGRIRSTNLRACETLFGSGQPWGSTEPYLTFRRLFDNHFALPYRLGAVVLAMIYYTHRVRES
jgi:hypothetical protein